MKRFVRRAQVGPALPSTNRSVWFRQVNLIDEHQRERGFRT